MAVAGLGLSGLHMPYTFAQGSPNNKVVVAVMGVNGRGDGMARQFARMPNCEIGYVCDVDERAAARTIERLATAQANKPKAEKDFRKALEDKGVDALLIAAPDHWHAPAAIIGCAMGKHVYVEKPLSHNPNEGELLIQAARKYNKVVQMGSQRRSSPGVTQMIKDLKDGIIGNAYMAKAWYANARGATNLQDAAVPSWLDYDLWQGPAPRKPFKNNLIHYNWHWLWHWGTGEALNNGTHEVDVSRWGLGVEFPIRVSSAGGRYAFQDSWETPDTQTISIEFPDNKLIVWEGRSCNNFRIEGSERGVVFYGTNGTLVYPGEKSYKVFDRQRRLIKDSVDATDTGDTTNTASTDENMDRLHIENFLDCVRTGKRPNADVEIGHRSTLLVQLGNIAWLSKQTLEIDPKTGRIIKNPAAQKFWSRKYEKGWEPKV